MRDAVEISNNAARGAASSTPPSPPPPFPIQSWQARRRFLLYVTLLQLDDSVDAAAPFVSASLLVPVVLMMMELESDPWWERLQDWEVGCDPGR